MRIKKNYRGVRYGKSHTYLTSFFTSSVNLTHEHYLSHVSYYFMKVFFHG